MFCGKCGSQIPDGNMFCSNCGSPVQGAAQAQQPDMQQFDAPVMQPAYDTAPPVNDTPVQQFGGTQYQQPQSVPQFIGQQPQYGVPQSAAEPVRKSGDPVKVMVGVIIGLVIVAVILLAVNLGRNGAFSSSRDRDDDDDNGTSISLNELKTANGNAKTAYCFVAEYVADQECLGISLDTTMDDIIGVYDLSRTDYSGFGYQFCSEMRDCGIEEGYVFVMRANVTDYTSFATQYSKDGSSGYEGSAVGQYPNPITKEYSDKVDFGYYYGEEERDRDNEGGFDAGDVFDD